MNLKKVLLLPWKLSKKSVDAIPSLACWRYSLDPVADPIKLKTNEEPLFFAAKLGHFIIYDFFSKCNKHAVVFNIKNWKEEKKVL